MATVETLGVLVPSEHIAKVIGKAGAGLRQIREASGAKVQVHPSVDPQGGGATRRVDLTGQGEQLVGAFQVLLSKAFAEGTGTPTLLITNDKAGQVVGRGGDNLKKIREDCRVRVSLERDALVDPASGLQERVLTMSGETSQMARALRYIVCGGAPGGKLPTTLALTAGGQATAPTSVRKPSSDPDEVQLQFTIPDRYAGSILGKGGQQVKQTAVTAGCKVTMTTRGQGLERRAVLIGSYSQCLVAQGILNDQLVEASRAAGQELTEVTVTFLVRKEAAGAVIGKAGATLKQIREASGAKVQLAREEVEAQRPCTLTGSLQAVMYAEKSIFELVRSVPVAYAGAAFPAAPYAGDGYATYDAGANKRSDAPALAPALTPTAKRQRVDAAEATTKLLVPAQCAGAVIGKQGSGLKEIRESSRAHVDMLQQQQAPQWPNDRVLILKGSPAARQAAVLAVLRLAFQMNSESCSLKMLVSGQQAGSIIGKQGATLKYIREQCGTSVQVEREEVFGERLVKATGPQGPVSAAAVAICSVLDSQNQTEEAAPPEQVAALSYEAYGGAALPTAGAYVQQ